MTLTALAPQMTPSIIKNSYL
jgi:hypothetical protein